MTIGGYILIGRNGAPTYSYCGTMIVYDTAEKAAEVARGVNARPDTQLIGPVRAAAVEICIRDGVVMAVEAAKRS